MHTYYFCISVLSEIMSWQGTLQVFTGGKLITFHLTNLTYPLVAVFSARTQLEFAEDSSLSLVKKGLQIFFTAFPTASD